MIRQLISEFWLGFTLPFRGAAFIYRHSGLWRYIILPLLANGILYVLAMLLFFYILATWDTGGVAWNFWGPVGGWLAFLANYFFVALKIAAAVLACVFAYLTFTGVGMVITSPLNDILSEKVEDAWRGSPQPVNLPFSLSLWLSLLGIFDSLRTFLWQLLCILVAIPFLLFPVAGVIPLFVVGAYFAGFGFLDSALTRNFLRPRHKRLLARRHFWRLFGFGSSMQLLFLFPLTGLLIMPLGVTTGTLLYCQGDWPELFRQAALPFPPGFTPPVRQVNEIQPALTVKNSFS
ncbi:MAG: EI24 domain-containing protein [Planctomycetota bacterium]|jgi:CysZ protein|nr:EI24 domain-containing protein [Planctomycetota bacterium]